MLTSQYAAVAVASTGQSDFSVTETASWPGQQVTVFSVQHEGGNYQLNSGNVDTTLMVPIGSIVALTATVSTNVSRQASITGILDVRVTAPTSAGPPLVTVTNTGLGTPPNGNPRVQEQNIVIHFNGVLNAAEADHVGTYRLVAAGKRGSFAATNARSITLAWAWYDQATNIVVLRARKPFSLIRPLQLTIHGTGPSGLQDAEGRLIDGDRNGQPGGDAVLVITSNGVS